MYTIWRLLSLLRFLFEDPRFPLFVFLMLPAVAYHFASPQVLYHPPIRFQAKWRPKGLKFCVQEEGEVMYFGTRSTGNAALDSCGVNQLWKFVAYICLHAL